MTHALNMTLPLKQDAVSQGKAGALGGELRRRRPAEEIERALKKSRLVHFARVLVIDNKYIQVITEYEGDLGVYTEFFRKELAPIFGAIFELAEGAPSANETNAFFTYAKDHNVRALGLDKHGSLDFSGKSAGWLFSAYDHKDVRTIQDALGQTP